MRRRFLVCCFAILSILTYILTKVNLERRSKVIDHTNTGVMNNPMVLLFSYQRSGSTFTANIIQQSPEIFYVYEPLYFVCPMCYFKEKESCSNFNDSCRILTNFSASFATDSLKKFYNCDVLNLPDSVMHGINHTSLQSHSQLDLMDCYKTIKNKKDCLNEWRNQCLSRTRFSKILRIEAKLAANLMETFPNMKFIHLFCDPRGILNSVKDIGWQKNHIDTYQFASALCERYKRDTDMIKYLYKAYPGKVKTIMYEAIADKPEAAFRNLYTFIGLKFTSNIKRSIHLHTHGHADNGKFYITRKNASETAQKWRQSSNFSTIEIIDSACAHVYDVLGYNILRNEEQLKNIKYRSWAEKLDFGNYL